MADDKESDKRRSEDEPEADAYEDYAGDEHLFDETEFDVEGASIPRDPETAQRLFRAIENLVPGVVKRTINAGVESVGSSEDSLRQLLIDRKLPREAVSFILGQVDSTKREVVRVMSREVRLFLENLDLGGELAKILTSLSFEVRMEVRFIPNDRALKPNARGKVRLKRTRRDGDKPAGGGEADAPDDGDGEAIEEEFEINEPGSRLRRWAKRRRDQSGEEPAAPDESEET